MLAAAALEEHHAQARVHVRIGAPDFDGDGDFPAQLGKDLPALGVNPAFEVLYLRPSAMPAMVQYSVFSVQYPEAMTG